MMNKRKQRVFLVEDDTPTLQRLAAILAQAPELEVVGMAGTFSEASAWLEQQAPDVLLTDLGLPDGNGKQLIEQTRQLHPRAEIMVISRFGDENSVVEAIKAGAGGYLLKDESHEHILSAVEQLLQGGSPISPAIARYILDYFQHEDVTEAAVSPDGGDSDNLLTPKEKMVLQYISRGYSNKEIARSLDISPHTVASHIKRIYRKLEVNSRNEAVYEGWRMGQLTMRQQGGAASSQKNARQIAESLLLGDKSAIEVMDVLKLAYGMELEAGIELLHQLEVPVSDIFAMACQCFQLQDRQVVEHMLNAGISHEAALKAMLDRI
ncbi:MAG: response regulator transcription factor [Thiothrix sp.]|nr:response regulator transcription factor [Thiothrix sp.]HPQ97318.1 response regulator transcription factor [Thiolinea sp.]